MMNKLIFLGLFIPVLMLTAIPNVSATGIRHDPGDDATEEESECFVNGYDSGFAGKYDKDRAKECIEHSNQYNEMWSVGCEHSLRTESECAELINNPVEIEDYKELKFENDRTCNDAGFEDGKAGTYNEERNRGCYEFGDYENQFQLGCETHTTESSCKLMYEDKSYFCPNNPDIAGCVEFLHNATNKMPGESSFNTNCANLNTICPGEPNPEKYCLQYDTSYCKVVGDLCDPDGFVKPEYPYCKGD